jgi:hypothetical protein
VAKLNQDYLVNKPGLFQEDICEHQQSSQEDKTTRDEDFPKDTRLRLPSVKLDVTE